MRRVLVIEDHYHAIFTQCFSQEKIVFDLAQDFVTGQKYLETTQYDFIFLDNYLPLSANDTTVQSIGYTLIPLIRARTPKTVIIGISSTHGQADTDGYFDKRNSNCEDLKLILNHHYGKLIQLN